MSGLELYFRLQLLLVECCKVLRKLFSHKAENDTTTGVIYTMESYIKNHKPKIKSLVKSKILHKKQYDILFNPGKKVCEKDMDITLVSCLLLNILPPLPPQDEQAIKDIREIRNKLNHCEDITTANNFSNESNTLENAMQHLSSTISSTYAAETKAAIQKVKETPPPPGPYLEVIKELTLAVRVAGDIEHLIETTDTTQSYVKGFVHVNKRLNEPPVKRVKIYHPGLDRMQNKHHSEERLLYIMSFRHRMERMKESDRAMELPSMESALRDHRRLYVIGQTQVLYMNTVLIAIKNLRIDPKRCAEMKQCCEWKNINRDDVDLVLFPYSIDREQNSVKKALECFDKILEELEELPLDQRMYIIITSDPEARRLLLEEYNEDTHPLLSEILEIKEPTLGTKEDPHIVNDDKTIAAIKDTYESTLKNLKEHSQIYLDQFKMESVPAHCLQEAKGLLKRHKHLRIDGPRGSGRMSLAVKLLSSYKLEKCLLLQLPTDVHHIHLNEVSVVLIEDFQGQYQPDRQIALQWYRVFDILLAMVRSGKLKVVITTETTMFNACRLPEHDLLQHFVTLTPSVRPGVKVDPDQPSTSDSLPGSAEVLMSPNRKRTSLWEASFKEAGITHVEASNITECTFLPTGHLVLACINSVVLMDIELRNILDTIDTKAVDICVTSEMEVVTVDGNSPNLQVLNIGKEPLFLTPGRHINIEDAVGYKARCQSVDASNIQIYVLCTKVHKVHMLSYRGILLNTVPLSDLNIRGLDWLYTKLKINKTGDKMFFPNQSCYTTICKSTPTGQRRYDFFFHRVMYIDDEDTYLARGGITGEVLMYDSEGRIRGLEFDIDSQSCIGYRESDGYLVIGCSDKIRIYCPA